MYDLLRWFHSHVEHITGLSTLDLYLRHLLCEKLKYIQRLLCKVILMFDEQYPQMFTRSQTALNDVGQQAMSESTFNNIVSSRRVLALRNFFLSQHFGQPQLQPHTHFVGIKN